MSGPSLRSIPVSLAATTLQVSVAAETVVDEAGEPAVVTLLHRTSCEGVEPFARLPLNRHGASANRHQACGPLIGRLPLGSRCYRGNERNADCRIERAGGCRLSYFQQCSDTSEYSVWMMFNSAQFWRFYWSFRRFVPVDARQIGMDGALDRLGDGGLSQVGGAYRFQRARLAQKVSQLVAGCQSAEKLLQHVDLADYRLVSLAEPRPRITDPSRKYAPKCRIAGGPSKAVPYLESSERFLGSAYPL